MEEENEKIVIHDHEKFWNDLVFKSNIGNLDGMLRDCKGKKIGSKLGSDAKVLALFKESNNVKKFMIGKDIYAFITKIDNLTKEAENLENRVYIKDLISGYKIVCVKGGKNENKKKMEWNFYNEFYCKLDKDLNVLISEKR